MRILKTFFRELTTQSNTACNLRSINDFVRQTIRMRTLSLGIRLIVLRGRNTRSTRNDLIVLRFLPAAPPLPLKRVAVVKWYPGQEACVRTRMQTRKARRWRQRRRERSRNLDSKSRDAKLCPDRWAEREKHFKRLIRRADHSIPRWTGLLLVTFRRQIRQWSSSPCTVRSGYDRFLRPPDPRQPMKYSTGKLLSLRAFQSTLCRQRCAPPHEFCNVKMVDIC